MLTDYVDTLSLANIAVNGGPHPSKHVLAKWAMGNDAWWWLVHLCRAMLDEQQHRFAEYDEDAAVSLESMAHPDDGGPRFKVPRFVQLIPGKIPGSPVEAYRKWYQSTAVPSWTKTGKPRWWAGSEQMTLSF